MRLDYWSQPYPRDSEHARWIRAALRGENVAHPEEAADAAVKTAGTNAVGPVWFASLWEGLPCEIAG